MNAIAVLWDYITNYEVLNGHLKLHPNRLDGLLSIVFEDSGMVARIFYHDSFVKMARCLKNQIKLIKKNGNEDLSEHTLKRRKIL